MLKLTIPLTLVVGIALLGFALDSQSTSRRLKEPSRPQPRWIFASGRVEGLCPEIELRPQLAGRILELPVRAGQQVLPGELLLRLDDAQYRHQVAAAEAELERAAGELERLLNGARIEERQEAAAIYRAREAEVQGLILKTDRTGKLLKSQSVAQQEADDQNSQLSAIQAQAAAALERFKSLTAPAREDDVRVAQSRVSQAQAQLDFARDQVERASIRALRGGEILQVNFEPGEMAGPEMLAPAIVLCDTSRFQVRAFVEELDAARVEVEMPVKIVADGLKGREFTGKVARMNSRMGPKQIHGNQANERFDTKVREVWIAIERGESLVVGLPVDVTIEPKAVTIEPKVDYLPNSRAVNRSTEALP